MGRKNIFAFSLVLILIYFLLASVLYLDKAGVYTDEGLKGLISLNLISDYKTHWTKDYLSAGMVGFYQGIADNYLQAFFFILFGPTVFVLRFFYVFCAFLTLILVYSVCKKWFDKNVALITVFLLSTETSFIRSARFGNVRDEIFQIFIFWLGLYFIQKYLEKNKKVYLCACGFVCGFALWAKIMFLAYFFGLIAAMVFMWEKAKALLKEKFRGFKDAFYFVAYFFLGGLPFFMFNIFNGWATVRDLINSFLNKNTINWNNLDIINNMILRIKHLNFVLSGNIGDSITVNENYLNLVLFYFSLLFVLIYLFFIKKEFFSKNKVSFMLIVYAVVFILTCFVPIAAQEGHVIMIFPIVHLVIALAINLILKLYNKNYVVYLLSFVLLANVCLQINSTKDYILAIKNEKGQGVFSPISFEVADYLEKNNISEIFSLTEIGLSGIDFITGRKVFTWGFYEEDGAFFEHPIRLQHLKNDNEKIEIEQVYNEQLKQYNYFYVLAEKGNKFSENNLLWLRNKASFGSRRIKLVKKFVDIDKKTTLKLYLIKKWSK